VSLRDQLNDDLKEAMRRGETVRRDTIRLLLAAIKNEEIARGHALFDDEVQEVTRRLIRQREESIVEFRKGGRQDLVEREEAEIAVLRSYLPPEMSREDVERRVRAAIAEVGATGPRDIGRVMGRLATELRGKADLGQVREIVQQVLSG